MGNPPYQDNSGNKGKGHTLWTKFVELAIKKLLHINGFLLFIHPSVWRQIDHPCLKLIKDKQLLYLEIHNSNDGIKMFKCATRYDWYVLCNTPNNKKTIIKGEDGIINNINLNEWAFIPNMMFNEIYKMICTTNRIDILHSESAYEPRKKWMNGKKDDIFKYPCIYSINKKNDPSLKYSSINTKGHFGIPKVIFSNGAGLIVDKNGDYGMTQWASAIIDVPDNLEIIKKALQTDKFQNIKCAIQLDSSTYNIKVMKLFKKNFYDEFNNL